MSYSEKNPPIPKSTPKNLITHFNRCVNVAREFSWLWWIPSEGKRGFEMRMPLATYHEAPTVRRIERKIRFVFVEKKLRIYFDDIVFLSSETFIDYLTSFMNRWYLQRLVIKEIHELGIWEKMYIELCKSDGCGIFRHEAQENKDIICEKYQISNDDHWLSVLWKFDTLLQQEIQAKEKS